MKLEDFEVNIRVNGTNLREYGEETRSKEGVSIVSCWIPSVVGQVSLDTVFVSDAQIKAISVLL
jgi:hypothetical protein